jgi:hypothetical protein
MKWGGARMRFGFSSGTSAPMHIVFLLPAQHIVVFMLLSTGVLVDGLHYLSTPLASLVGINV